MAKTKIKRLYLMPILSKALDVIELLEGESGSVNLEDIYQRTRISKTSVYRILKTFQHRGYVAQNQSCEYRLVSRPKRLRCNADGSSVLDSQKPAALCRVEFQERSKVCVSE